MGWLQIICLALLQGATEFLPISSSGHLVLLPTLFHWQDQGLLFDVAVHFGTLLAVLLYFRKEVLCMITDWSRSLVGGPKTRHSKLAWNIGFATLFVALAGFLFQDFISENLRNPKVIAISTIVFGILLGLADKLGLKDKNIEKIGLRESLVIGAAQTLALIPGTSRSGITLTAGLMLGFTRQAAARFSFLLAIPVITVAAGLFISQLIGLNQPVQWWLLILATLLSFLIALLCIHLFLNYLAKFSLMPFVIYRLILGVVLLIIFI